MADNRQYQTEADASGSSHKSIFRMMKEVSDMSMCIVLDGLPIVMDLDKVNKMRMALVNIFDQKKCPPKRFDIMINEMGTTLGYAFLEYENRMDADKALTILNNVPLDKHHRLRTNAWNDFDTYVTSPPSNATLPMDATMQDPVLDVTPTLFEHPYQWLQENNAREQYIMKSGNAFDVEIYWNDPHMTLKRERIVGKQIQEELKLKDTSEAIQSSEGLTRNPPKEWISHDVQKGRVLKDYPTWSPLGTYIISLDTDGVSTWIQHQQTFHRFLRFDHYLVNKVAFSPNETYIITGCRKQCTLWHARLGRYITSFPIGVDIEKPWPIFLWNFNETMFAQLLTTNLLLYPIKTNVPIAISLGPNMTSCVAWSPTSTHIIYATVQNGGESNLRVILENISSIQVRKEIALRNLFGVQRAQLLWREKGNLCLCIMNLKSTGRADKIDIFRILPSNEASVEQIEIAGEILHVAWDPSGLYGSRFVVVSTLNKHIQNIHIVSFYHISPSGTRLLHTLNHRTTRTALWSPSGTHVVCVDMNGSLEFISIASDGIVKSLHSVDHPGHHQVTWDHSGRYFTTITSMQSTSELDLGFQIFNFLGQKIYVQSQISKFSHLHWRPRPLPLLSNTSIQNILKTLKKRVEKYEMEDIERIEKDQQIAKMEMEETQHRYARTLQSIKDSFKAKTKDREKRIGRLYHGQAMFHLIKKVREEVEMYV